MDGVKNFVGPWGKKDRRNLHKYYVAQLKIFVFAGRCPLSTPLSELIHAILIIFFKSAPLTHHYC
jgi:hypothetical protein